MIRRIWYLAFVLILVIGILKYGDSIWESGKAVVVSRVTDNVQGITKQVVVIDPGHGGEDPGKVGINGALEKDINLQVALLLQEILLADGYEVIMTREEDQGMLPEETFNKVEDLEARVVLMNDVEPDLVVSIHQNSYTDESVKGPQVFYYSSSAEGEKAAQIVQEKLWELDPDSVRQIKANDTYYILTRTSSPTIIVECGFLSNSSDAQKLVEEEYQRLLAQNIAEGIETYLKNML